jgi:hypothetical protein
MQLTLEPSQIIGFPIKEIGRLQSLLEIYRYHLSNNGEKDEYYEGKISLSKVNLGIALPGALRNLEIGCAWGAKAVDVLAARSMFDGFVGANGAEVESLNEIVLQNNLLTEYSKATRDELKYGCTFATLSGDKKTGGKVKFHSPNTAAALWNGEKGRIDCGFAIIDTAPDEKDETMYVPSKINYYTDDATYVLFRWDGDIWYSQKFEHKMGRPLMEALVWNATSNKPFGRSRIKEPIRRLIDGYVRTLANAAIGLEFATAPQKYILGVNDDQFDAITGDKFKTYVGSIIAATTNYETGEKPTVGQLPQGSLAPHIEMIRMLATQFSAATGLSVTDTGVVSEANPTSADAVIAQTQTLIAMAEQLNAGNGAALRNIALMALAISNDSGIDGLTDDQKEIVAHFKNPAMPSVAATADAAIKIATAREGFGSTDVFLEMIGFDQADIRRIKAQEQRFRGTQVLTEVVEEEE